MKCIKCKVCRDIDQTISIVRSIDWLLTRFLLLLFTSVSKLKYRLISKLQKKNNIYGIPLYKNADLSYYLQYNLRNWCKKRNPFLHIFTVITLSNLGQVIKAENVHIFSADTILWQVFIHKLPYGCVALLHFKETRNSLSKAAYNFSTNACKWAEKCSMKSKNGAHSKIHWKNICGILWIETRIPNACVIHANNSLRMNVEISREVCSDNVLTKLDLIQLFNALMLTNLN